MKTTSILGPVLPGLLSLTAACGATIDTDVCVYGGTAPGVAAALAAHRHGRSVVIIEPSRWLGGMTGGGIRTIDWGDRSVVGGICATVFEDHAADPVYRQRYRDLVDTQGITVLYERRLGAIRRDGQRITALSVDLAPPDALGTPPATPVQADESSIRAAVFIDASYEGDLMAGAGVSCTTGREGRDAYGESLAGTRPPLMTYGIDPYVIPGNPASGLIPLVTDENLGPEGSADRLTMAYVFRWKLTTEPDRLPFGEPESYDPAQYELFRRAFSAGIDIAAGRRMREPGVFTEERGNFFNENSCRALMAPSIPGSNRDYPEGDWSTRSRIWRSHREFVRGLVRFLKTDPSVPERYRRQAGQVGLARGYFDDTAGWPHQLYVREARRMRSAYVITEHDLAGRTDPQDAVALGSYGVDDWPYAIVPVPGGVALQGGEFSILRLGGDFAGVYAIPYRSIVPRAGECSNLLVPVCHSASHIAMTSTRMETTWTMIGEAAGIAAALAVRDGTSVQDLPYPVLRPALVDAGLKLIRQRGRASAHP